MLRLRSASSLLQSAFQHFRSRRMLLFEKTFKISRETRVLDVGGSPEIWLFASIHPRLTVINLPAALRSSGEGVAVLAGDGRMLPFRDGSFDIVFSNSVIEHVGKREDQQRFADEVSRVGRHYWIQTPNRNFPLELHLMMPLIHRLPEAAPEGHRPALYSLGNGRETDRTRARFLHRSFSERHQSARRPCASITVSASTHFD